MHRGGFNMIAGVKNQKQNIKASFYNVFVTI
jgi:hypothetical protein